MRPRALPLIFALATASSFGCRVQAEQPTALVEQPAPDFSLPSHDGRTVSLGELTAQGPAIVVFYRGDW